MNFPIFPSTSDLTELDKKHQYYFLIGKDGYFLRKQTALYNAIVRVDEIAHLPEVDETLTPQFKPLPYVMLQSIVAFLRAVYERFRGEGIVILCYNPTTGRWDWVVPPQETTKNGLSVNYDPKTVEIPAGYVLAGTVHSHCDAGAFQSGTDSHDENHFDGLHITVGNLNTIPSFHIRFIAHGSTWNFEDQGKLVEELEGNFPQGLLDRVKERTFSQAAPSVADQYDERGMLFGEQTAACTGLGSQPPLLSSSGGIYDRKAQAYVEPYNCKDDAWEVGSTVQYLGRTWVKRAQGKWVLDFADSKGLSKKEWRELREKGKQRARGKS